MRAFKDETNFADYLDYIWCNEPVFETLKIQVLDCRSNEAVTNARVKKVILNGAYTINKEFDENSEKAEDSNKVKQSQIALNKLGFSIDNPGTSYNDTSYTAYKNYMESRFPDLSDEDIEFLMPGSPTDELMDHIINEHNGSLSTDDNGLINLQIPKDLLNSATTIEIGLRDFPILLEATTNSENNSENNVLRDSDAVGGGTDYQIRWGDGTETSPNDVTQDTEWNGNWGWRMKKDDRVTEFKVSLQIPIKESNKNFSAFETDYLSHFYEDTNSPYHLVIYAMQWCQPVWDGIEDPDPENGQRSNSHSFINRYDTVNGWIRGLNMHIVSKYAAGIYDKHGHYFGFFDVDDNTHRYQSKTPNNRPHRGIDLYSGENGNNPVFAVHSGKLENSYSSSGYGNRSFLKLRPNLNTPMFHYAHLSNLPTEIHVMTGRFFGNCGRSGYNTAPSHLHFELINNQGVKVEFNEIGNIDITPANSIDDYNSIPFQGNRLPLMLPCQCHSTTANNCMYGSNNNLSYKTCWAVREYPYTSSLLNTASHNNCDQHPDGFPFDNLEIARYICPNILNNNANKSAQLQAKLRFLIENAGLGGLPVSTYLNEYKIRTSINTVSNGLDGEIGNTTRLHVAAVLKTFQDTLNNSDNNITIEIISSNTNNGHCNLFINRYISNNNPSSGNSFVDAAYEWFCSIDFSNMCYNS